MRKYLQVLIHNDKKI